MGRRRQPVLEIPDERVDERDTIFARAARSAGSPAFEDYYTRLRPELAEEDARFHALPPLLDPRGLFFDETISREAGEYFERIDALRADAELAAERGRLIAEATDKTAALRRLACELGAVAAGACAIDEAFVYTVKGRFDSNYGEPITLDHGHALVFLVEMDFDAMQRAPRAEVIRESARQYYRAARISFELVAALEAAGYEARAHYDAHYDVILPPLAIAAGLGELGRNNILVADRFGSRVRIGAVSTSLALTPAEPIDLGVAYFCEICKKCAENCPSRSLSMGERVEVRGVLKWPTETESCYAYWRRIGSDCGICMAVCPFSHVNNWFHNLVRFGIRSSRLFARFALWCDDLLYGRDWRQRRTRPSGRRGEPVE